MDLIADRMIRGAEVVADKDDPFECSDKMGAALIAAGVAHAAPEAAAAPEPEPAPVVETAAEQPAEPVEKAVEPPPARRNKRRKAAAKKVSGAK